MPSLSKPAFLRELVILMDIHGKQWEEESMIAFYEAVQDLETDLVLQAFRELLQQVAWMPKPAEVRGLVAEIKRAKTSALPTRQDLSGFHDDNPALCQRLNCESLNCQGYIDERRQEFKEHLAKILDPHNRERLAQRPSYFELIGLHEMRPIAIVFLRTPEGREWLKSHPAPAVQQGLEILEAHWCREQREVSA